MKICFFGFENASADVIFQDERLSNLRRVMDAGLYGPLLGNASSYPDPSSASIWKYLVENGKSVILMSSDGASENRPSDLSPDRLFNSMQAQWDAARTRMAAESWDGFCFVDHGLGQFSGEANLQRIADYYVALDEQIGSIMELLDDQTILVIASAGNPQAVDSLGFFALVAPNSPISGEYDGASLVDIAPTVLDLAGYTIPPTMQGKSLVAGMEKRTVSEEDPEKIIYDRLAGLGYV